jgi:hypothetical protein
MANLDDLTKAAALKRLVSRMNKNVNDKGCWTLDTSIQANGYSRFRYGGRVDTGHNVMFNLKKGPLPDGMEVGHVCNTRNCIRPDHLQAVTHVDNMIAVSKEWAARKTTEPPLSKAGILINKTT